MSGFLLSPGVYKPGLSFKRRGPSKPPGSCRDCRRPKVPGMTKCAYHREKARACHGFDKWRPGGPGRPPKRGGEA